MDPTAYLYNTVAGAIQPVAHLEKEWNAQKLQQKLVEYLNKAGKENKGHKEWKQLVRDYTDKFYEAMYKTLGDRSYVQTMDFSLMVLVGLQTYCPSILAAPQEELMQYVSETCENSFDSCRYYCERHVVIKDVIPGKQSQKKVREAVDNAREEVLKLGSATTNDFISKWVELTVQELKKTGGPGGCLPQSLAVRLFNELIRAGGGLPPKLTKLGGMNVDGSPSDTASEVNEACTQHYKGIPTHTGGGKGSGGGGYRPGASAPAANMNFGCGGYGQAALAANMNFGCGGYGQHAPAANMNFGCGGYGPAASAPAANMNFPQMNFGAPASNMNPAAEPFAMMMNLMMNQQFGGNRPSPY